MKRKYLVNKRYQIGFIVKLCAPVILMGIFSVFLVYQKAHMALIESMYRSHLASGDIGKTLESPIINANVLVLALTGIMAVLAIIYVGNRANAALVDIESRLRNFGQAKPDSREIKETSLWVGIEKDAVRGFQERMMEFGRAADTLEELESIIRRSGTSNLGPDRADMVDFIRKSESQCRHSLNRFRL